MNGTNQPNPPLLQPPAPRRSPTQFAALLGEYVQAGVRSAFWILVAAASLGGLYIGLRATYWAVQHVSQALGV
jgi:hypothetical protein